MEKKLTNPPLKNNGRDPFGNTKGNTKTTSNTMPQSGGPKTPPPPRGSSNSR